MPRITASGTYTADTPGFGFLKGSDEQRVLLFAGASSGDGISVMYDDDEENEQEYENASFTILPRSVEVPGTRAAKIVVTGVPDFNVSKG